MFQSKPVVVEQPVSAPTTATQVQDQQPQPATDFLILSVVLMVICCVHCNILSVLLTIPALICSFLVCYT